MSEQKYWRVFLKGGHKAHLTRVSATQLGPAEYALCGKLVTGQPRRGTPKTIDEPDGTECDYCQRVAGYLKWPRGKPSPSSAFNLFCKQVALWNMPDKQKEKLLSAVAGVVRDAESK